MKSLMANCLCGAVEMELKLPTAFLSHCHCESCRKAHSAPLVTWTGVPNKQFRFVKGKDSLTQYHSSNHATRSFCKICGSQLTYVSTEWPGKVYVPAATIMGELDRKPEEHINFMERVTWMEFEDELPKHDRFPEME